MAAKKVAKKVVKKSDIINKKVKVQEKDKPPFKHAKLAKPKPEVNPKAEKVAVKVNKKALKVPKSLAACADALYETKAARLAAQNEIKPLAQFEADLKNYLVDNLPKSQAEGISGKVSNAKIVRKEIPKIEDEKKFLAFAKKAGNEDLLKIVPNMEAIQERWENNKAVPGVGKFTVVTVSSTKL